MSFSVGAMIIFGLLGILALTGIAALCLVHTHLKAIRGHLATMAAHRQDLSPVRYLADEMIVLRTMLNCNFGAMHKVAMRIAETLDRNPNLGVQTIVEQTELRKSIK